MPFRYFTPREVFSVGLVFPLIYIAFIGVRVDFLFKTFQFRDKKAGIKVIDSWIVMSWVVLAMKGFCPPSLVCFFFFYSTAPWRQVTNTGRSTRCMMHRNQFVLTH